jgi:hypothetical protein
VHTHPDGHILLGSWSYRSFYNDPDLGTPLDALELGSGTITVQHAPMNEFRGVIGGEGWQLKLKGSTNYGNPFTVRFQGTGVIGGEEWIYDYVGYLALPWPNGVDQRPAMVGSIVRTLPHKSSSGGISPAGVVGSWFAVKQDNPDD